MMTPVETQVNMDYLRLVQADLNTVKTLWPDIAAEDPLRLVASTPDDLLGFMEPFCPAVFDAQAACDGFNIAYTAGINFSGLT